MGTKLLYYIIQNRTQCFSCLALGGDVRCSKAVVMGHVQLLHVVQQASKLLLLKHDNTLTSLPERLIFHQLLIRDAAVVTF